MVIDDETSKHRVYDPVLPLVASVGAYHNPRICNKVSKAKIYKGGTHADGGLILHETIRQQLQGKMVPDIMGPGEMAFILLVTEKFIHENFPEFMAAIKDSDDDNTKLLFHPEYSIPPAHNSATHATTSDQAKKSKTWSEEHIACYLVLKK